jgi:hypothetical protein
MRGKTFLSLITIAACSLFLAVSFSGCGKKKQADGKGNQVPQLAKESSGADTSDIFKEFYSEDTASKGKTAQKKGAKQQTFSTASQSSSASAEFSETGRYTVQISCVKSQSFANSMVSKMKDKGYPAYVAEVQNPTPNLSGTFYRVRIGGFDGLSAAKSFGENTLVASGYEYWVDKKSNDNVGMEGYGLGSGAAGSSAAGSYDAAGSSSTYQSTPSSGFGSSSSTESSYSTTPSSEPASSGTSTSTTSSSVESSSSGASSTPASSTTTSEPAASSTATTSSTTTSTSTSTTSTTATPATGSTTSGTTGTSGTSGTGTTGTSGGWGKDSSSGGW